MTHPRSSLLPPLLLGLLGSFAVACMDLDITNINEPDRTQALEQAEDVGALISASYNTWFQASYSAGWGASTPGLLLGIQSFQGSTVWANWGSVAYGGIPRAGFPTAAPIPYSNVLSFAWENAYGALAALALGLDALNHPDVARELTTEELVRYRAYGRFVQGLAHGTLALLHARGFILDETTDQTEPQSPVDYGVLMEAALGYLDEAIDLAGEADLDFPFDWMQADLTSGDLARLAHSYKARFRSQVARTPEEREAVDWNAVMADVDAGIQATHTIYMDWEAGWYNGFLNVATTPTATGQLPYFIYGMADQSGSVAAWLALPMDEKNPRLPDGSPVLIETPDLRFPQGSTVEAQRANEGTLIRVLQEGEEGHPYIWGNPTRGTWRWTWYMAGNGRGRDYVTTGQLNQPEITLAEMRLLKAESLFRAGDLAAAAGIVNESRTAAGLSPTDASGTNVSCVPRLPDGSCGDLWEMLKWEKRMETVWTGALGANWFFDGRGWGDLWKDTPLHHPIPCAELEILVLTPCPTFGGPGGEMGSPGSTYRFPNEW